MWMIGELVSSGLGFVVQAVEEALSIATVLVGRFASWTDEHSSYDADGTDYDDGHSVLR